MPKNLPRTLLFSALLLLVLGLPALGSSTTEAIAQQPTVDVPTVTSTDQGAYIIVDPSQDHANVRTGPDTSYPSVGVLVGGERASAKGRSAAGLWVLIAYPSSPSGDGWVYAPLVSLFEEGNTLPIVEPPPTPTPRVTPTIDPTLAAQFVLEVPATRLPTFTAPPPVEVPVFEEASPPGAAGVPMGMIITGIGLVGLLGAAASFLRDR